MTESHTFEEPISWQRSKEAILRKSARVRRIRNKLKEERKQAYRNRRS